MTKRVYCTHCGEGVEVAARALSSVCPRCNRRLAIEDVRVHQYYAVRKVATCGDVLVAERGHLVASVQAVNLTVDGKLKGNVKARGFVRIGRKASVQGDIEAPSLSVENGAELTGDLRIGPERTA